tara:strand:+ start:1517 stop:1723 length:207 start_codon:yes stop_codon:yes gene_type:complete
VINKLLADLVFKQVLKVVAKRFKPLEKYVNEENELDVAVEKLEHRTNELSIRTDKVLREFQELKKRRN